MKHFSILAAAVLLTTAAHAEGKSPEAADARPALTLNAQASQKVATDEMVALLGVTREGTNLGALNQAVLTELQGALAQARQVAGVNGRLGAVQTQRTYSQKGEPNGWRVVGTLELDSRKLKELGDLVGALSLRLEMRGVSFRLSSQRTKELEEQLLVDAAKSFGQKARSLATSFGYAGYRLKEVSVSQARPGPDPGIAVPMMAMKAQAMAPASMPAEGGEVELSVTMSGTVTLN